jgi:uncharacterized protein YggT (Ycf19 family)
MEGAAVTARDGRLTMANMARLVLWITWAWVLLDLFLLLAAFILQLLGANPDAEFARWVYRSAERSMAPFRGIFTPIELTDRSVLDTSLLFAMMIYAFAAILLQNVLDRLASWTYRRRYELAIQTASAPQAEPSRTIADEAPRPAARFPDLVVPARGAGRQPGSDNR